MIIVKSIEFMRKMILIFLFPVCLYGQGQIKIKLDLVDMRKYENIEMPNLSKGEWEYLGKRYKIIIADIDKNLRFGEDIDQINISGPDNNSINIKAFDNFCILDSVFSITHIDSSGLSIIFQKEASGQCEHDLSAKMPRFERLGSMDSALQKLEFDTLNKKFDYYYINVWSYNCSPCMRNIDYLNDFSQFNTQVVNICGSCDKDKLNSILSKNKIPGYHFYCERDTLDRLLPWARGFPSSMLLDKLGKPIHISSIDEIEPYYTLNKLHLETVIKTQLNILFIGNSLLSNNHIIDAFNKFCVSQKKSVHIESSIINAASLSDQLEYNYDGEYRFPQKVNNTSQTPIAIKKLESKYWDYIILVPGGTDLKSYQKIRGIVSPQSKIIYYDGLPRKLWSSARRSIETTEHDSINNVIKSINNAFDIGLYRSFNFWIDNYLSIGGMPYDPSWHLTECGEKIVTCLLIEKVLGSLSQEMVKEIVSDTNLTIPIYNTLLNNKFKGGH